RLSTTAELPLIAGNRGLEPRKLRGLVRGELDWIAMKALEKDRSRRYETAGAFATDVQRYLNDEPVLASPPSTTYRLRKFVRRTKSAVLASAVVLLALVVGIVLATVGLVQAEVARQAEAEQRGQLEVALRDLKREQGEKDQEHRKAIANAATALKRTEMLE